MTVSFLVTRRALSLGAQDAVTGWYAPTFTESTGLCSYHGIVDSCYDKMAIVPKGTNLTQYGIGGYAKYTNTGIICAPLEEGDEIIANSKYYEVATVEDVDVGDSHMWYVCELHEAQMHWDEPSYGTGASVYDPERQTKIFLDGNILNANLLKNDGVTQATKITCWDGAPYPIKKVFLTKGVDVVFSVGRSSSQPQSGADKYIYGYDEKVKVSVSAVNKTGISGKNLMWQGERELRRICEANPLGSVRNLDTATMKTQQLGSLTLYSVDCSMDYSRMKT